jgi:hypothetical protein
MAGTITAETSVGKGRGVVRIDALVTCDSGAVPATVIGAAYGRLVAVLIDPAAGDGATMSATADILVTDALTGAPIISDLSAGSGSQMYRPTQVVTDNAGAAITAATTAVDVNRDIFVAGKIKLAIANATTTDTARICLVIEEA